MKNKTSIVVIVIIIILAGILFANKSDFVSRIRNQASTMMGFSSGSGSHSGQSGFASGSGSAINTGSGSTLKITYLGNPLDMWHIQIRSQANLQEFYSKIQPLPNYDGTSFYNDAKDWISGGSVIDIYLDRSKNMESSAIYGGFYVNKEFIVESPSCKFTAEFSAKTLSFSTSNTGSTSKTPKIDSMNLGICAPLSAAYSINNVLKLTPPAGIATSTVVGGKRIWNKEYLEWLMKNTIPQNGATAPQDVLNFYKMYLSKMGINAWVSHPEILKIWKAVLGRLASVNKIDFIKIISLYYSKKTDCSIVSYGLQEGGKLIGHISHISNIYIKDGKQYIEITNTLDQGGKKHVNIPTEQGKTTLIVESDGTITLGHHDSKVSKRQRAIWDNMLSVGVFSIICVSTK